MSVSQDKYLTILMRSMEQHGLEAQLLMLAEECSEVIKEIMKRHRKDDIAINKFRGPKNIEAICDEIADVCVNSRICRQATQLLSV